MTARELPPSVGNLEFLSLNPKTLGRFQSMFEALMQQAIEDGDNRLVHRIAPLMLRQVLFLTALRKQAGDTGRPPIDISVGSLE